MDKASQQEFDRLIKLNPEDLSTEERGFLRARRDYMNNEQKRVFESVLGETVPVGEESVPVVKKPGRPKKV